MLGNIFTGKSVDNQDIIAPPRSLHKRQSITYMDSARKVNQVVGKGGSDGQAQRLWTALRASINDLARAYNLTPVGA